MKSWLRPSLLLLGVAVAAAAHAVDVRFERVADGVYAYIGELGARTYDNEGLNANLGLIVTPGGAVLIDSGATARGAAQIHAAVKRVTEQPVRWVIHTGGQDHRWLGNGYFKSQGAHLIAHANDRADMQNRGNDHLQALRAVLKERTEGTTPTMADRFVEGTDVRLELGGTAFELRHRGGAHTPGDTMVWLPATQVLFTGDVVYVERMLGVLPVSSTKQWLATFDVIEQLAPVRVVPGHGKVTDVATARADTRAYLETLRAHMKKAVDDGTDISAAIKSFDAQPFMRLLNAADLHPGNASRTYLELERE